MGLNPKQYNEATKFAANYAHDNDIDAIFLIDRAARNAHFGIRHHWNQMFPGEKRPDIYFTDPESYVASNSVSLAKLFRKSYPNLKEGSNVLVYDACIHTGRTIRPFLITLEEAGFENYKLGVHNNESMLHQEVDFQTTTPSGRGSGLRGLMINQGCSPLATLCAEVEVSMIPGLGIDVKMTTRNPACHPFGYSPGGVRKQSGSLYSERDPSNVNESVEEKKEIIKFLRESNE